jgi:D-glycero-D-manno-heptose 1,7-bisphosphate phosphatase
MKIPKVSSKGLEGETMPVKCYAGGIGYTIAKKDGILSFCRDNAGKAGSRPTVFLDRDGVLNRRVVGGYVTRWTEFKILPGVLPALRTLRALNFLLVVVSNQAGVAKGLLSCEDLAEITCENLNTFAASGGIDAAFFCLHQPSDGCLCRKPGVGLLRLAGERLNVDFQRSFLVGDSPADIQAGQAVGCKTVYLTRLPDDSLNASFWTGTLGQAARWISKQSGK